MSVSLLGFFSISSIKAIRIKQILTTIQAQGFRGRMLNVVGFKQLALHRSLFESLQVTFYKLTLTINAI
jgi:hypothetical protein